MTRFKVELLVDVSDRQLEDGHILHWSWTDVIGLSPDAIVIDSTVVETEEDELDA